MAAPTTLRPTTSLASRNDVSPIPNIQSQANQNETMPISREQSTEENIFQSTRNNEGSFATTSVTSDSSFEDIGGKNIKEVITNFEELLARCYMHNIKLTRWKLQFRHKVTFAIMI